MDDCASVLRGKYPAKAHARRVAEYLRANDRSGSYPTAVLYLEGRVTKLLEDSDMEEPFRQRRLFYYLTGCSLPDCYFVYDMAADRSILFIPPVDSATVMWSGLPMSLEEARSAYDVDEVRYAAAVPATLVSLGEKSSPSRSKVYAIANQVSHHVTFVQFDEKDFGLLRTGIETCRVVKDEYEIALIRRANHISRDAHHAAMRAAARARNETEVHAAFLEACVAAGAKNQAYDPIVASGRAAATLHYIRNDQPMEGKQNLLLDGGCEWDCYASDVTRTYPISGKFTAESRAIYDLVLQMQQRSLDAIKAGVRWEDVHTIAHRVAIDGLLKLGILRGDRDAIFQSRTSVAFFPHGLGHYLGLDTHDTGGNADYQDPDPMFRYVRIRGLLPEGSVVTVEPGIYFSNFIIGSYLDDKNHAKFIDADVLETYWPVGGVRIEDNVVVTRTGVDNLTTAIKDPDEIEALVGRPGDS